MGRHEPLTALALGRSPYDEVVWPEGDPNYPDADVDADADYDDDDEHHHEQRYDHKGRPVNPATKRMNRDIVRAHNEVMHVIGVAEPEGNNNSSGGGGALGNDSEVQSARRYLQYEHDVGDRMERLGKGLMEVGIWAFTGIRHRVLVYKAFSQVPYYKLVALCKQTIPRPLMGLFLAGLPTDLAARMARFLYGTVINTVLYDVPLPWQILDGIEEYLTYHAELWVFLQRIGILSPWRLPSPLFFIPFTSASLIPAPEPPADFSIDSILQWLGSAAINASPLICYALWRRTWTNIRERLMPEICFRFPLPPGTPEYRIWPGPPPPMAPEQIPPPPPATAQQPYVPIPDDGSGTASNATRQRDAAEPNPDTGR